MPQPEQGFTDRGDGIRLAWRRQMGRGPTVVFLPGYRSDMAGAKATEIERLCAERGASSLLLDYSGHGRSGGTFTDGTIGRWTADALHLVDELTTGPLLLVGSSMGGWIALLLALAQMGRVPERVPDRGPDRVAGLIGLAAAPDFTERLMWAAMPPAEQQTLMRDGVLMVPSPYGEPLAITRALIEDGRTHLLLDRPIPLRCPVRLLHGQADPDVPWETSLTLAARLDSPDVRVTLIKDGDHRLSRPEDLALLRGAVDAFLD